MKIQSVVFLQALAVAFAVSNMAPAYSQMFSLSHNFDDPTPTHQDFFGGAVAIDGNFGLIGAVGHGGLSGCNSSPSSCGGQAHLFDMTSGALLRTFNDPNRTSIQNGDQFGVSVAMAGNHILIGEDGNTETQPHQAYLFDADTGSLLQTFNDPTPEFNGKFGASLAISAGRVLIGDSRDDTQGTDVGQAHLFDLAGNLLWTFNDPTVTEGDKFGGSVALDENHVLIGAGFDDTNGNDVGQAHLFDVAGNLLQTYDDPTITDRDRFGAVALDGNHVLIGARFDDTNGDNVGQAHLFDLAGNLLRTYDDPTVTNGDSFGRVALDGHRVLIGASNDDTLGQGVGQVHLFDLAGNLLQTFDDPTVTEGDIFSRAVIDGNRIVIGASGDDTQGLNIGQAHLFTADSTPDFNNDGLIDCVDANSLVMEIVAGTNNGNFDLTGDGLVDSADLDEWLVQGGAVNLPSGNPYLEGDANLDGEVDGQDFIEWNANKFTSEAAWCSGDFNADGLIDGLDFVIWNANKFMSSDDANAVPEPNLGLLLITALTGLAVARRRRPSQTAACGGVNHR